VKLIVGLGNPGAQYERTRHNAGFLALDRLAQRHAAGLVARSRFHAATLETALGAGGQRCLLMKPLTFMNRSGLAVSEAVRFYKVDPASDLLVIVDDVYLPCGSLRLRGEGSAGGHNGLADIQRALGTDRYARCRIGVDTPGIVPQADYVLGRFTDDQWSAVGPAVERSCDAAEVWANSGLTAAMNRFNAKTPDGSAPKTEREKGTQEQSPGRPESSPAPGKPDARQEQ
jgi:PTH1 family peptidyl-tRNA hydrolase